MNHGLVDGLRDSMAMAQAQNQVSPDVLPSALRFSDVQIKKVSNGFIVTVGCKTFVARTWKEVSEGLAEYWENPALAEKKYCK